VLLAPLGCGSTGSDPKKDTPPPKDKDTSPQKDKDASTTKDSVSVKATVLGEAFRMDKAGAEKRYQGKTLTVEGQVYTLQSGDGKLTVVLIGDAVYPGAGNPSQPIDCLFEGAEADRVANLTPTQFVKLTGKYQGVDGRRVKLGECKLEKAFDNPATAVTSTDLAKALVTNAEGSFTKFVGRYVAVEGKVVEGPPALRMKNVFFLEGYQKDGDKQPVLVRVKCSDAQADAIKALKPGDTVKVKGKCRGRPDDVTVDIEFFAWIK
jgi:hypothetical protein